MILAAEGYQVSVAADGWQALELSQHGTKWPDLVIADYNLPDGLNGLDVIVSLQDRLDHDVAAIILTGGVSSSASQAIESRGCVCLSKPVKGAELVDAVRLALAGPRANAATASMAANGQDSPAVFVVDDDPAILEAMRDLLEANGCVVKTFTTGAAFFAASRPDRNGCVLVDAFMPGMDGFELIERLRAGNYALPAIMVTGAGDVPMAVRAMKAGAVDFIEKPVSARELLDCLHNALKPAPHAVAASSRQKAAEARFATLTERQRQIIDLILAGQANKNIAARLGLSQRTVESHRAAIMRKTGARSFAALVRWAIAAN
jgi:two-component system CheB/CheR fusion protein